MSTLQERKDEMLKLISDPDIEHTLTEALTFMYHWYRYEWAVFRRDKYRRQVKKYADLANADYDVFMLRKEMKDL